MTRIAVACILLSTSVVAFALDWDDPFATGRLPRPTALGSIAAGDSSACSAEVPEDAALSLAEVVDRVLCRNPQTHEVWANARVQAAEVGVARAAYLPSIDATAGIEHNRTSGGNRGGFGNFGGTTGSGSLAGSSQSGSSDYNQVSAGVSLSYLLYDFGGRDAALENARQLFEAANATQDNVVQGLFFSAIQGYYQVNAAQAAVASALEAERSSKASLDAATARYQVGVGTPADRLQAQTAHSQAVLDRIRAEGALRNARGTLANLMGMDAHRSFTLQPAADTPATDQFQANVGELIAEARKRRPDLVAAEAQVAAAQAGIASARAAGKPRISVSTDLAYLDRESSDASRSGGIGLNVTIPLFTGFANTYRIRSATEQAEARKAARDQVALQIALDVWQAYQNLQTETQSVQTSVDLVASATQNADVALGRYKAGVGNIIDVITAQAALASARAQRIQARFNWDIARASLAYSMGRLDDVAADTRSPLSSESQQ
jgi:outer membrane protein